MQVFTRRGFQLRTASLETRLAYTCFLLLMLLGLATQVIQPSPNLAAKS